MTGEYAHTRFVPAIDWRMSPRERTIADELSDAGYQTIYIGKWHLSGYTLNVFEDEVDDPDRESRFPVHSPRHSKELQGGFDEWKGFELRNNPFDTVYFDNEDTEPKQLDGYQTDELFDLALVEINRRTNTDQPFFLMLSVEPPHPPFAAPEEDLKRLADRGLNLRPNVPYGDTDRLPEPYDSWGSTDTAGDQLFDRSQYFRDSALDDMRAYYAMIENLDRNVGRLMHILDSAELRNSSALVFLSDHGEMLSSHGLSAKQHPYEESIGIPLILSYPDGEIGGGTVFDDPVCSEDIFPTITGLAQTGGQSDKPGRNLIPALRTNSSLDRDGILLEFVAEFRDWQPYSDETWRGFRTERYKYTVKGTAGGKPWQLYDLHNDPFEQNNVIDDPDYRDVAERLHTLLRERMDQVDDSYVLEPAFGVEGLNTWYSRE